MTVRANRCVDVTCMHRKHSLAVPSVFLLADCAFALFSLPPHVYPSHILSVLQVLDRSLRAVAEALAGRGRS
jgi:hypothetical protein